MEIPKHLPSALSLEGFRKASEARGAEVARRTAGEKSRSNERSTPAVAPPAASAMAATQDLPRADLDQLVEELNVRAQAIHRDLQFSVDDSSGRTVITLSDSQTGEVIRQIPSDAVLRLAERLAEGRAIDGRNDGAGRVQYRLAEDRAGFGSGALLDADL